MITSEKNSVSNQADVKGWPYFSETLHQCYSHWVNRQMIPASSVVI